MNRLWDYLMTGDWETANRIQVLRAKAYLLEELGDLVNDLSDEEILEMVNNLKR